LWLVGLTACTPGESATELRLYEFDCGRLRYDSPEAIGFGVRDDATDVRELFVPCYVIDHPNGHLLWDGGLGSELAETSGWTDGGMRLDRPLADRLDEVGFSLDSLAYVAFSHMHFDHVGVANEVGGGILLIQQTEYAAAFADEITVPGFNRSLYDGLEGMERVLLNGDHDVFGDGRVRILSLPGHTPGHQGLFVDLENEGPVVLSGDLYHFRLSREERIVPSFNVDAEATLRSMDRLEAFLLEAEATLWIEHDLARYADGIPAAGYHN
jgi:glyoxylase-like metal-dependent hydrolase (beta-lactamase superfamily II)